MTGAIEGLSKAACTRTPALLNRVALTIGNDLQRSRAGDSRQHHVQQARGMPQAHTDKPKGTLMLSTMQGITI